MATYELTLEPGSYSLTGSDVDLLCSRVLSLEAGSYSLTGSDVAFKHTYKLSLESGSYSLTGSDVSLLCSRKLSLESGSYEITDSELLHLILSETAITRHWLFNASTYYWGSSETGFDGDTYEAKIISGSFSGITLRRIEGGLCNLAELTFEIVDPPAGVDLTGEVATLRLLLNSSVVETFALSIRRYELLYGKAKIYCTSLLEKYLDSQHPSTKKPGSIWVSDQADPDDNYVVPQIFGAAMIPIRSVTVG